MANVRVAVSLWCLQQYVMRGDRTLDDLLSMVATMGVKAVEIPEDFLGQKPHPHLSELRALRRQVKSKGLEVNSCWFGTDIIAAVALGSAGRVVENLAEYLEIASEVSARYVVLNSGDPISGMSEREGLALLRGVFEAVLPAAERAGVVLALEAARPASAFNSPAGALRIVKDLNSRYLTVCPDFESWQQVSAEKPAFYAEQPGVAFTTSSTLEEFAEVLASSRVVHAKMLELDANGEDLQIPVRRLLEEIKKSSQSFDLVVEYEGWIPDMHPGRDPYGETLKAVHLVNSILSTGGKRP